MTPSRHVCPLRVASPQLATSSPVLSALSSQVTPSLQLGPLRPSPLITHPLPSALSPLRVSSAPTAPPPQAKLRPHAPIGQLPPALRDVDGAAASDWLADPPLVGERGGAVEAASRRWEAAKRSGTAGTGPASCPRGSPGSYPHFWEPARRRPQRPESCLLQAPLGDKQAQPAASFPPIGGRVSNAVGYRARKTEPRSMIGRLDRAPGRAFRSDSLRGKVRAPPRGDWLVRLRARTVSQNLIGSGWKAGVNPLLAQRLAFQVPISLAVTPSAVGFACAEVGVEGRRCVGLLKVACACAARGLVGAAALALSCPR